MVRIINTVCRFVTLWHRQHTSFTLALYQHV